MNELSAQIEQHLRAEKRWFSTGEIVNRFGVSERELRAVPGAWNPPAREAAASRATPQILHRETQARADARRAIPFNRTPRTQPTDRHKRMTQNDQIKSVQTALGLDADGKPGPKTWSAIYDRIVGAEKPPLQVPRTRPLRVCIDPGHGMSNKKRNVWDGGCERGTLKEANIVLDYGMLLQAMLKQRGVEVVMTRQDQQKHTPLTSRAALAEEHRCDMLVSIHVNDSNPSATGTETLIRSTGSKPLASRLHLAMLGGLGLKDRGVKVRDDLAVLKFSRPAVLLELGFIETDGRKITDPAAMRKTCELLAAAIAEGSK